MVWMNLLTCSTALPFLPSKGWNFRGSYPLGYCLPRSSGGNGGSQENCLGIPESFSFSCSRRALTSASVRYWGLVPPPTAYPPSGWVLSWLPTGGCCPWPPVSCLLWGGKPLAINSSTLQSFEPRGPAPALRSFALTRPLTLSRAPRLFVWRPLHFLPRA